MFLFASVIKAILEIPLPHATDQPLLHQDQKSLIPADQVLVASMLNAEKEMELPLAPVFQVSLEIPMCNVNQSAQLIPNALQTRPVSIRSV